MGLIYEHSTVAGPEPIFYSQHENTAADVMYGFLAGPIKALLTTTYNPRQYGV